MKRFLVCIFLVFTLLITACAEIESPDSSNSSVDSIEESITASISTDDINSSTETSIDLNSSESFDVETDDSSTETSADTSKEDLTVSVDDNSSATDSSIPDDNNSNDDASTPPSVPNGGTAVPTDKVFVSNGFVISGTRGMEQYFGGIQSGANFCNIVNNFKNDLGDGINLYTVVAPHSSNYYAPESYSHLIERGKLNFDNIKSNLSSDVKFVDTYNALWNHVDEPIYPRTECHWGALAAYYAAEEFAKVAGVDFAPLSSYKEIVKPGFVGSVYTFSKAEVIRQNPEDFYIYMPQTEYTAYYYNQGNYDLSKPNATKNTIVFDTKSYAGAFICGDTYAIKIQTNNNTGRKLVILKDSYGNAFAPFTIGSFDEIYILDIRYYKRNGVKFCKDVGATDVAIAVSAFTATGTVYKHLENLRTAP